MLLRATGAALLATSTPRQALRYSTSSLKSSPLARIAPSAAFTRKMHSLTPSAPGKPLYSAQQSLPKLPVAPLVETAEKYLRTLKPILSDVDYSRSEKIVKDFIKPGGQGEQLHARLEERKKSEGTSWLYEWWNDYAYMSYRDPVVINVSYFFVFKDEIRKEWKAPAKRAAALITGALEFKQKVVGEELQPETAKGGPLSMDQFQWMFNACRIPKKPSDTTAVADPQKNSHVIVIRKNQFFNLDTRHPDGRQLSTAELERQIQAIYQQAGDVKDPAVGALTSENRDTWTEVRDQMLQSPRNRASLETIESAAFVVCLDDSSPVTRDESSRACWHGDGRNRFFDKPLQFIVFENGKAGFLGEHSMMDATPTSMMCEYICKGLDRNTINHGTQNSDSLSTPRKLPFDVSNLEAPIKTAEKNFDALIARHDLRVQAFYGYGKDLIKKFKMSPDAYVQMAIQLAHYKMFGVCKPTYESAQTRKFGFGRTETCRSVSVESVEWVKAMENSTVPIAQKVDLGKKAVGAHIKYMNDCVEGKGVDRLWLGLKLALKPHEPVPEFFKDPAFDYSKHWFLSTSQISSEYYEGYGWGEVVPNGFGIAYMVKERSLHFNVAALNEMRPDRMHHFLGEALRDMQVVFESGLATSAPPPKAKL
ncbi:Carnitine O-acetyltransferase mitochondrial [Thoreauomyces humboldtii]|nr:Carnitine O-acetyltransferase mitochondrial [Thoreauomyces humboldtii]